MHGKSTEKAAEKIVFCIWQIFGFRGILLKYGCLWNMSKRTSCF